MNSELHKFNIKVISFSKNIKIINNGTKTAGI